MRGYGIATIKIVVNFAAWNYKNSYEKETGR